MSHHPGPAPYHNIYPFQNPRLRDLLRWQWQKYIWPRQRPQHQFELVPRTTPDLAALNTAHQRCSVTWIGHASSFIQLQGLNILMDPIWSQRTSPVQWAGPKRQIAVPMALEALPAIDLVLISHNHYDHLDFNTVRALAQQSAYTPHFIVPCGVGKILRRAGVPDSHLHELSWWESYTQGKVKIRLTPAHHWSKRGLGDENHSLWGGFAVQGGGVQIWFPGDTGYHPRLFKEIGQQLGPIDLALLPIGAYEPRWFLRPQHVNPAESVQIFQDIQARRAWAIHWGTFLLSDEAIQQPMQDLLLALATQNLSTDNFQVPAIGETCWLS